MPAANPTVPVPASPALTGTRLSEWVVAGVLVLLALAALYAVFFDQGMMLSSMFGATSYDSNYLHEFAHDGRHLFGMPCH